MNLLAISFFVVVALLMGTGDFLSQTVVEKKHAKDYNIVRTLKFAGFGFFLAVRA